MSESNNILNKGDRINDTYDVQCFIGKGAFGEVYRVKHKFMGIQVLKVLQTEYVENTDIETVTSEARILSGLTHSNIVRVFDTNTFERQSKSYHFITMGFVSGESLAQLLKREISLSVPVSLSVEIAILHGLYEVHNQDPPIIHRDISPDNILLSYENKEPRALLSDFGLAQSIDQLSGISAAAGKYLYFSPECFWGAYLPASDIFSVGVVLYRMLTGSFPWNYDFDTLDDDDRDNVTTMILKAQKIKPKPPSFYNAECSEDLDRIALKAISQELEDRYCNVKDFLDDLIAEQSKDVFDIEKIDILYY